MYHRYGVCSFRYNKYQGMGCAPKWDFWVSGFLTKSGTQLLVSCKKTTICKPNTNTILPYREPDEPSQLQNVLEETPVPSPPVTADNNEPSSWLESNTAQEVPVTPAPLETTRPMIFPPFMD